MAEQSQQWTNPRPRQGLRGEWRPPRLRAWLMRNRGVAVVAVAFAEVGTAVFTGGHGFSVFAAAMAVGGVAVAGLMELVDRGDTTTPSLRRAAVNGVVCGAALLIAALAVFPVSSAVGQALAQVGAGAAGSASTWATLALVVGRGWGRSL